MGKNTLTNDINNNEFIDNMKKFDGGKVLYQGSEIRTRTGVQIGKRDRLSPGGIGMTIKEGDGYET